MVTSDNGGKKSFNKPKYGEKKGPDKNKRFSNSSYKGNRDNGKDGGREGGRDFKDGKREGYRGGNSEQRNGNFRNNEGQKQFKKRNSDRGYNPYDKDEDDNPRPQRRQPARDNKVKEQQPDKVEIINRIEKERKAMQKKQAEKRNSKPARMQTRPKRTNNIDWTREYENGSYDDDDLDMYL